MRRRYLGAACLCLLLALAGFVLASLAWPSHPHKRSTAGTPIESAAGLPPAAPDTKSEATKTERTAGRKIFLDPVTGELTGPPAQAAPAIPPVDDALSTSGEGLRETPGKTRRGGVKIDLQGRFRSTVTATIDAEGNLTTRCVTESEPSSSDAGR